MMKNKKQVIAITGGIGSGKSYVCKLLEQRGIAVYDCDVAAKRLMQEDHTLQAALKALVGADVYLHNQLQKSVLAQFLLASESNKQAINDIVHPAVAKDFLQSSYQWVESAILFDACFDKRINPDKVICVTAPFNIRVERIMQRDNIDRTQATEWINRQMPQEEIVQRSNFELVNDGTGGTHRLQQQIDNILRQFCNHQTENSFFNGAAE